MAAGVSYCPAHGLLEPLPKQESQFYGPEQRLSDFILNAYYVS
jgi:hypothetical protein